MKTKLLLAGMMISTSSVFASNVVANSVLASTMPEICKTAVNYTAQTLSLYFTDGSIADKSNPSSILLKRNFRKYPITSIKDLGNCEESNTNLKDSWCQVAGGSPEVYQVEVSENQKYGSFPPATVIVTFNRGGCWVDEVSKK